jgi:hypothetical protein
MITIANSRMFLIRRHSLSRRLHFLMWQRCGCCSPPLHISGNQDAICLLSPPRKGTNQPGMLHEIMLLYADLHKLAIVCPSMNWLRCLLLVATGNAGKDQL